MTESTTFNRKEQIKKVAQNLFREKGYPATSMRDLAKNVGIEPASLYSHIKSKEDILKEISFRIAQEFFNSIDEVRILNIPADEKLKLAIVGHIKVVRNHADASAVFLHEWRFLSEPFLTQFKTQRRTYEYHFKSILEEGIQRGVFKNINIKIILPSLLSALNWTYEWNRPASSIGPEEIGEEIYEMILNGINK